MKIKINDFAGEYVADQADTTYVLAEGAIVRNMAGRALDGEDSATGKSFVINGALISSGIGMTAGSPQALASSQHIAVGERGVIDADGTAVGLFGDGSRLVNRGLIRSLNDNASGIVAQGADIDIVNSGTIIGQAGIRGGDDGLAITNSGVISARGIGVHIGLTAGESGRLVNSGTISSDTFALHGSAGMETIVNSGVLSGSVLLADGNDVFRNRGGSVSGTISGGMGDDTFHVDKASLTLLEAVNQGYDTVRSSVSWTLGNYFEKAILTGSRNIDLTGQDLGSTLIGNRGVNVIDGRGGVDYLLGQSGDDTLTGGTGGDFFIFRRGCDFDVVTDFEDGVDRLDLSQYKGVDGFDDLVIKDDGNDVVIRFGNGDGVLVSAIDASQLTEADFVF